MLFVECFMLYFNVTTYGETLDSLVIGHNDNKSKNLNRAFVKTIDLN